MLPDEPQGADGEGRVNTVSATGQDPVTATSYNVFSEPTLVTFGSGDSDAFAYDGNTGRMTKYTYNVAAQSVVGSLTWNSNGTLGTLGINDQLNASNSQTCNYTYDDLARVNTVGCGIWSQTFTIGAFGNVSYTGSNGGTSFQPTFQTSPSITNRISMVGGQTYTYDSNGNLLSTGTGTGTSAYAWDADGNLVTETPSGGGGGTRTYDALDRMVEAGGTPVQFVYGPLGDKQDLMQGTTALQGRVMLPGGAVAEYTGGTTLSYYWHSDWQGSVRLATTSSQGLWMDSAYAPYGEQYALSGANWAGYAGTQQNVVFGTYDADFRHYDPGQARWLSPDPAGLAAVDLTNPQSWNRYAYVDNSPCTATDPLGLKSDPCNTKDPTNQRVIDFINANGSAVSPVAASLGLTPDLILGLAASETGYGTSYLSKSPDNNFFGVNFGKNPPDNTPAWATGSIQDAKNGLYYAQFSGPGIGSSLDWFQTNYGNTVAGQTNPADFTIALTAKFNSAEPGFFTSTLGGINGIDARINCPSSKLRAFGGGGSGGGSYLPGFGPTGGWDPFAYFPFIFGTDNQSGSANGDDAGPGSGWCPWCSPPVLQRRI